MGVSCRAVWIIATPPLATPIAGSHAMLHAQHMKRMDTEHELLEKGMALLVHRSDCLLMFLMSPDCNCALGLWRVDSLFETEHEPILYFTSPSTVSFWCLATTVEEITYIDTFLTVILLHC